MYVSGQQIAGWIDETQWQRLKTPPEELPQITYSLEYLLGENARSEIHLFAADPTLAAVIYGDETAYYTIDPSAYAKLETLIFQNGGDTYVQVIRISERIAALLDEIESSPAASSAPGDYLAAHPEAVEELLGYGQTTLL